MFEVGKTYRITTGTGDAEGYSSYTVLDYDAPLLKVEGGAGISIFNTHSPSFVSAELHQNDANPQSTIFIDLD